MRLTLRRGLVFFNVLLLILSVIALGNQPEFKSKRESVGTRSQGNGGGDGSGTMNGQQQLPAVPGAAPPVDSGGPASPPPPPKVQTRSGGKPPASVPPKPGTYRYRMTFKRTSDGGGQQSEESREISITVETVSSSEAETRQIYGLGSGQGSFKQEISWRPSEVVHLRWFSEGENAFSCDWQPDLLVRRLPLQKGAKWDAKSSCEQTSDSFSIRLDYEGTFHVTDAVSGELEGTSFTGWQMENTAKITSQFGEGSGTQERITTEINSPAHGLLVRSITKTHSTGPDGSTFDGEETMELLSFKPA